ncbi:MAG: PQQ-binding-like beta-propeller repeat protein [Verrucomicrobiota bacterium]
MSASIALKRRSLPLAIFSLTIVRFLAVHAADWPQFRGQSRDGISTDRITTQWTGSVTNPLWFVSFTNGPCSFSVSAGRALTQVRRATNNVEKDFCVALNAANGTQLWTALVDDGDYPDFGVGFSDDGPRTTPTIDGDSVYVLSSYLKLARLNVTNGATIWQKDLRAIYGGDVITWQNAASPVLEDGFIFVNANCGTSTLMALRASDGEPAWRSQNEVMTHSTPTLATIHGVRQVIFATQSGLVSLNSKTGNLLWKFNYPFSYSTSLAVSPVVYNDMVFITGFYGMGATVAKISSTNGTFTPSRLWFNSSLQSHWSTPVCYQGYLFGQFTPDGANAQLRCIDMATGALKWATNGFGRGSVSLVGNRLLAITERGQLVVAEPNTNSYAEVARFLAIPGYNDGANKCWNSLAIADGKVFVRSTAFAAAFDFSLPGLKLEPPVLNSANQIQLTIRTVDGSPFSSNRFVGLQVLATTNLALSTSLWPALTNNLFLTNDVVRVNGVGATSPAKFFIVHEP